VQFFLDKNIARLPFSVDPFVALGPFAHHFLYDHHNKAPIKPTSTYLSKPNKPLNWLYPYPQTSLAQPTNTSKHSLPPKQLPLSPTSWATHTLALNASTALARHISKAISIILESQPNQTTPPLNILEFPFYPTVDNPILLPFPQALNTCA
jgi:hypothetical protein